MTTDELKEINAEIKRLKELRLKLYGKDWQKLVYEYRPMKKVPQEKIDKYIRFFEEQMALHNLKVWQVCKQLGLQRNAYAYLKRGECSIPTSETIERAMANVL